MIKNKLLRAIDYVKYLTGFAIATPVGAVLRKVSPQYKNVWLIAERGNDARDNGYCFYRYLRKEHQEINAIYVIADDSPDKYKVSSLGETVNFKSFKHYLLYHCADVLCSTHVYPAAPDLIAYYHLAQKGVHARGKQIFLQHGITKDEMAWMHYPTLKVDLFACGAKTEYDFIHDNFGYPDGVVRYLGFCRFDQLKRNYNPKRVILVMPTWRGSYYPSGEAFKETQYYNNFQSLLKNSKIVELLERLDYKLIFYPHIEMQGELHHFTTGSERIVLADKDSYDVQELLKDCAMLITDYSSVFFDVAYLRKPIIYYQFDKEEFRRYHYQQGYFVYERDGFGPVCETFDSLVNALNAIADNGFSMEDKYVQRVKACYEMEDTDNCKRTFEAISSLLK